MNDEWGVKAIAPEALRILAGRETTGHIARANIQALKGRRKSWRTSGARLIFIAASPVISPPANILRSLRDY